MGMNEIQELLAAVQQRSKVQSLGELSRAALNVETISDIRTVAASLFIKFEVHLGGK